MAEISIEVSQDSWDSSFVNLVGDFRGRYTSYEEGVSQAGKPKMTFIADIIAPESIEVNGKQVQVAGKQKIRDLVTLAATASWTIRGRLTAAGVPHTVEELPNGQARVKFDPDNFIGREVIFTLSQESAKDGSGKSFTRVDKTRPCE